MKPHERQGGSDSYALDGKEMERDGGGQHKLTYHHIVPEGKLLRLGDMIKRLEYLFNMKNVSTDRVKQLRDEIADLDTRIVHSKRVIKDGDKAAEQIDGLRRRNDPQAAAKAKDRGWNQALRDGETALAEMRGFRQEIKDKETEIDSLAASMAQSAEEKEVMKGVSDDDAVTGRRGSDGETREAFLKAQLAQLVASTRLQAQAVKDDALGEMRLSEDPNVTKRVAAYQQEDIRASIPTEYGASLGLAGAAWIPGNIHEGPSSRLSPNKPGFDPQRDDGGSEFETSAAELLEAPHFALLQELSESLKLFDPAKKAKIEQAQIDQFIDILQRINEIRRLYPDLTEFDTSKWEQIKVADGVRSSAGTVDPANRVAGAGHKTAGIIKN